MNNMLSFERVYALDWNCKWFNNVRIPIWSVDISYLMRRGKETHTKMGMKCKETNRTVHQIKRIHNFQMLIDSKQRSIAMLCNKNVCKCLVFLLTHSLFLFYNNIIFYSLSLSKCNSNINFVYVEIKNSDHIMSPITGMFSIGG